MVWTKLVHPQGFDYRFHPIVQEWFGAHFGAPTPPQAAGWPAIQRGENVLIVAPTGSGKTFAGFLVFIDRLLRERVEEREQGQTEERVDEQVREQEREQEREPARARERERKTTELATEGVRVVYISPLRALDHDVHRNLTPALTGISQMAAERIPGLRPLRAAVRTGDTLQAERRRQTNHPPELLITTPESLFLLLASPRGRHALRTVEAVIVDELHALAPNKRGAQLALTLEWLEWWTGRPLQRVGLSATQRPISRMATFLAGKRPVTLIHTGLRKGIDLTVDLPTPEPGEGGSPERTVWTSIFYNKLLQLIEGERKAGRSTLVFVNSRALAERVTARVSQLAGTDRFAAAHHGSLSRTVREQVEKDFKQGELAAVVATGSLELGIDVGLVDLVVQVESPHSVTRGLQRVGRAGHLFGARSRGIILPRSRMDLLEAAVAGEGVRRGEIEPTTLPRAPLDVLAQQVAAMVALDDWQGEELYRLFTRAGPYLSLTRSAFDSVLRLLSGGFRHPLLTRLRPRIAWDERSDTLRGLPGTRLAVLKGSGTIPDRGTYAVYTVGDRRHLGELDEEFVNETRRGDVVALGTTACRVERIEHDRVLVEPCAGTQGGGPLVRLPFWRGEGLGRTTFLGLQVGRFLREVEGWIRQWKEQHSGPAAGELASYLRKRLPLSENAAVALADHLVRQYERVGALPSDRCVLVEQFLDVNGDALVVVHSPFGGPVNQAWRLALADALAERWGIEAEVLATDDGLLLRLPSRSEKVPAHMLQQLAYLVGADEVENRIWRSLQGSALMGSTFRAAAGRALLLSRGRAGGRGRTPLWLQRLQAQDLWEATRHFAGFPVLVEAVREVFHDYLDVAALRAVLHGIRRGRIRVVSVVTRYPTPFTASLLANYAGAFIYDTDEPRLSGIARRSGTPELPQPRSQPLSLPRSQSPSLPLPPQAIGWLPGSLTYGVLHPHVLAELLDELKATEPGGDVRASGGAVLDYALTHGPFTIPELVRSLGVAAGEAEAEVRTEVERLVAAGELAVGSFRTAVAPAEGGASAEQPATEYCHIDFLRVWERRSLARQRQTVVCVQFSRYLHFLLRRHLGGAEGTLAEALWPLLGQSYPWDTWCYRLLPVRMPDSLPAAGSGGAGYVVGGMVGAAAGGGVGDVAGGRSAGGPGSGRGCGAGGMVGTVAGGRHSGWSAPASWRRGWEARLLADLAELGRSGRLVWRVRGGPSDPVVTLLPPSDDSEPVSPDVVPGVFPGAVPNVSPDVLPNVSPGVVPNVAPSAEPDAAPGPEPDAVAVAVPDAMPCTKQDALPGAGQGVLPGASPGLSSAMAAADELATDILRTLGGFGALFLRQLEVRLQQGQGRGPADAQGVRRALAWLFLHGAVTSDSPRPLFHLSQLATLAKGVELSDPHGRPQTAGEGPGRGQDRLAVWGRRGSSPRARREFLEASRRARAVIAGPEANTGAALLASELEKDLADGRWWVADSAVVAMDLASSLDRALDLFGILTPAVWSAWRKLLGEDAGPVPPWSEAYQELRRREWQGGVLRGRFVEELDDPQFMRAEDAGLLATAAVESAGDVDELVLLSAADPLVPYGLLVDWPEMAAGGRDPSTWLLFRLHGGMATLLWTYAPRSGVLRVLGDAWSLLGDDVQGAAVRALRRLFYLEPVVASAGKLQVSSYQEAGGPVSIWGSPLERPLREAGFRSSPRGLVLYAD